MADTNATYTGTVDFTDPDIIIARIPGGFWPWSPKKSIYLPDEIRTAIRETNQQAIDTVNAVKVAYTGSTEDERAKWLSDRIAAINERLLFIKARTDALLDNLKSSGQSGYDVALRLMTSVLSAVPLVGSFASYAVGKEQSAEAVETAKTQQLIQTYAQDVKMLVALRDTFTGELKKVQTSATTTTTSNAPTVSNTTLLIGGAGLLAASLIYAKKRTKKRK